MRIVDEYTGIAPRAERLRAVLCEQLQDLFGRGGLTLGVPLESRVKTLDSITQKLESRTGEISHLTELADLVGVRAILLFRRDLVRAANLIHSTFVIVSSEDASTRLNEAQFGYQSLHITLQLPSEWARVPTMADLCELRAEVQVRTVAQHIWAASSHKLQYKQESSVPPPVRRAIHRVSALLETVDLELERVLSDREVYVGSRSPDDDQALNVDNLPAVLAGVFPAVNRKGDENYAELLEELLRLGIVSTAELRAVLDAHAEAALKADAALVEKKRRSGNYLGTTKERIEAGVFFSHVGLAREALESKFGDKHVARVRSAARSAKSSGS